MALVGLGWPASLDQACAGRTCGCAPDSWAAACVLSLSQPTAADSRPWLHRVVLCRAGWDFWYVTTTLRPFFAPLRPMPRQAMVMQRYRAGALVYALQDCQGFVVSACV